MYHDSCDRRMIELSTTSWNSRFEWKYSICVTSCHFCPWMNDTYKCPLFFSRLLQRLMPWHPHGVLVNKYSLPWIPLKPHTMKSCIEWPFNTIISLQTTSMWWYHTWSSFGPACMSWHLIIPWCCLIMSWNMMMSVRRYVNTMKYQALEFEKSKVSIRRFKWIVRKILSQCLCTGWTFLE